MAINTKVTFKVLKLTNHSQGYKYNVKKYVNGYYAGVGRFCYNLAEVNMFKKKNK